MAAEMFAQLDKILEKGYTPDADAADVEGVNVTHAVVRELDAEQGLYKVGKSYTAKKVPSKDRQGYIFSTDYLPPDEQVKVINASGRLSRGIMVKQPASDDQQLPSVCSMYTPIRFYDSMAKIRKGVFAQRDNFFAELFARAEKDGKGFWFRAALIHLQKSGNDIVFDLTLVCARPGLKMPNDTTAFNCMYGLTKQLLSGQQIDLGSVMVKLHRPTDDPFTVFRDDRVLMLEATTALSSSVFRHKGFSFYPITSHLPELLNELSEESHAKAQDEAGILLFLKPEHIKFETRLPTEVGGKPIVGEQLFALAKDLSKRQDRLQGILRNLEPVKDAAGMAASASHETDWDAVQAAAQKADVSEAEKETLVHNYCRYLALTALFHVIAPVGHNFTDMIDDMENIKDVATFQDRVTKMLAVLPQKNKAKTLLKFAKDVRNRGNDETDVRLTMVQAVKEM